MSPQMEDDNEDWANRIIVKCYSGYKYPQEPQALWWQNREWKVKEIARAWLEPGKAYFQVLADEGATFLIWYDESQDCWFMK